MKANYLKALSAISLSLLLVGCTNSSSASQTVSNSSGYGNSNGQRSMNRPSFQKPDVYGEISKISGNTVTLKLLELPQMHGNYKNSSSSNTNSGGRPSGGYRRMTETFTGKEKTLVIPKNVSITTMTFGQNGMNQTKVNLSNLTTGSILSVFYNSDGKTIKSISVRTPRTGMGQTGSPNN